MIPADSTIVAWVLLALFVGVPLVVGAEGRARQLEALRRRDGDR